MQEEQIIQDQATPSDADTGGTQMTPSRRHEHAPEDLRIRGSEVAGDDDELESDSSSMQGERTRSRSLEVSPLPTSPHSDRPPPPKRIKLEHKRVSYSPSS